MSEPKVVLVAQESAAQVCNALGAQVFGYDIDEGRSVQAKNHGVSSLGKEDIEQVAHGCAPLHRGYDVVVECSGVAPARVMAILATKRWGEFPHFEEQLPKLKQQAPACLLVSSGLIALLSLKSGGYNNVTLDVSPWVIQKQLTIKGSWTCCE